MHGPDGRDYPNKSVFTDIVKPRHLCYSHGWDTKTDTGEMFLATWTFEEQGGKTLVTGRMVFPSVAERDRVVKEFGAIEGGKQHLGRLAEHLAKKPVFELVLERVIDAPRARVFEAWTKPDQMSQWFAPKPFKLIINTMNFRLGGGFSMAMRGPDGKDFPFTGIYREIVPPAKLSWTGEFTSGPADQVSTVVTLEEQGQKTQVHVRQTFRVMTPEIERATKGANQGWMMTLDQLAAFCSKEKLS